MEWNILLKINFNHYILKIPGFAFKISFKKIILLSKFQFFPELEESSAKFQVFKVFQVVWEPYCMEISIVGTRFLVPEELVLL